MAQSGGLLNNAMAQQQGLFLLGRSILWRSRSQKSSQTEASEEREEEKRKMIYRRWSLLTGPAAMVGGIVAAVVVANYLFVENVSSLSVIQP